MRLAKTILALAGATLALAAPSALATATPPPPLLYDFVGSNPKYTFTATPRFLVAGSKDETLKLYEGGTLLGSVAMSVDGETLLTVTTPLGDGWHTVYVTATDSLGATSPASLTTTIVVDTAAPPVSVPDLLAADDDGSSSSDDVTGNPRPRFSFTTEPGARVAVYENGVLLGAAAADGTGAATVRVSPVNWLDPGTHCVYAVATDALGNSSNATSSLCVTVTSGARPFTSNLGVALSAGSLSVSVRTTLAARATVRVLRSGRLVASATRLLAANTRTPLRLRLRGSSRGARGVFVVTRLVAADGRVLVMRRFVSR